MGVFQPTLQGKIIAAQRPALNHLPCPDRKRHMSSGNNAIEAFARSMPKCHSKAGSLISCFRIASSGAAIANQAAAQPATGPKICTLGNASDTRNMHHARPSRKICRRPCCTGANAPRQFATARIAPVDRKRVPGPHAIATAAAIADSVVNANRSDKRNCHAA